MKILLADDRKEDQYLLETILKAYDHQVVLASNGVKALEKLKNDDVDMIVSDILMPKMDGFQLCRECKGDPKLKKIPFIFYTSTYTNEQDEKFALSLGAARFLVKPVEPNVLVETLENVFADREKQSFTTPTRTSDEVAEYLEEHNKRLIAKLESRSLSLDKEAAKREEIEKKVRDQNKFLRDVMCALTHPFYVIDSNNYTIIMDNFSPELSGGVKNIKCYSHTHGRSKPCDGKEHPCPLRMIKRTKKPVLLEHTHLDKEGNESVVEIHAYPLFDERGEIVQMIEYCLDISERRKTEQALKVSEDRFRSLVETTSDWIWELDNGGNYTYSSPKVEELLGYKPEEILEKSMLDLMPDDEVRRINDKYREIIDSRKSFTALENTSLHRNGRRVLLETCGVPICGNKGDTKGYRGISRDVTERKHLQDQLIQAQKLEATGALAGGVAHDFNNLLTVILGSCDVLLEELDEHSEQYDCVEEIKEAGARGAAVAKQLLAFSRKQPTRPKALDLNAVASEMAKMIRRLIGEDIELKAALKPELHYVEADQGQMEQILMNLAVNARDAIPNGGKLTIATENVIVDEDYCKLNSEARPGAFVRLSVEDTGIGMDKDTIAHIFEPFFTTKKQGQGTGLGLSVIYGIVKQHEGWIKVYSESGNGSTFRVYLPAIPAQEQIEEDEDSIPMDELLGGGSRVLLVEDDEILCNFAAKILQEKGYLVRAAKSAEEAFAVFEKENGDFDLVLSDVILPGRSGLELVDMLLAQKPGLKVLLTSGYVDSKSKWNMIMERHFCFVQKPYNVADLLKAVKGAVKSKTETKRLI